MRSLLTALAGHTRKLVVAACLAACVFLAVSSNAEAKTVRSAKIGPHKRVSIPLRHHIRLVVPKRAVKRPGRVRVAALRGHTLSIGISVPWRRQIRVVANRHGRRYSRPLGGVLLTRSHRAKHHHATARAAIRFNPLGNVCVKLGIAVGSAAIVTGPFDLEIDGSAVVSCLARQGATYLGRFAMSKIATALGHDCAAALLKSTINDITFFRIPQCNEPKGPSGPSNGTPLVVATFSVPPSGGTPIGGSGPSKPTPTTTAPVAAGTFRVMNADGGIYWRSAPDWNAAVAVSGNGFYPGTVIKATCYQSGAGNVPGTSDTMWEQAEWVSGPGQGRGWVNEHFIDDGAAINQPSPGIPPCAPAPPPPADQTWNETAGGVAHTWTNYTNAGGAQGPSVASGQTVAIACRLQGFAVADGNTWWYRIASSPWGGGYYVSADAFYNNGATSGSLSGTPFVDPAVGGC